MLGIGGMTGKKVKECIRGLTDVNILVSTYGTCAWAQASSLGQMAPSTSVLLTMVNLMVQGLSRGRMDASTEVALRMDTSTGRERRRTRTGEYRKANGLMISSKAD